MGIVSNTRAEILRTEAERVAVADPFEEAEQIRATLLQRRSKG